jgi:ubiquinone biosynthesis UbiH/UbiF/VisC/COQ6 family hydroxylase
MNVNATPSSASGHTFDIVIVGAGPAGLCLAQSLKPLGLRVALVEQSGRDVLVNPPFDGREIALTLHSVEVLKQLGIWSLIPAQAISPLRDARVLNGADPFAMTISHRDAPAQAGAAPSELGFLVGNHHIRRAAFEALDAAEPVHAADEGPCTVLFHGLAVAQVHTASDRASVTLADGTLLYAELLVAADSRHSSTRRALGIAADMHDFGRSMLVCAMTHDEPHPHAAWEWFDMGQTLALLPMNPCPDTGMHRSSVVLTLPSHQMQAVQAMDEARFNADMAHRFAQRLGGMTQASTRHVYPLVAVYPRQLVAQRLACVGDAACGMHPVTAHGFNLGLRSVELLTAELKRAQSGGELLASPAALARYERAHRLVSRPVYLATQLVAQLYTQESPPARLLRHVALRVGERLAPFRRAVAASLTGH